VRVQPGVQSARERPYIIYIYIYIYIYTPVYYIYIYVRVKPDVQSARERAPVGYAASVLVALLARDIINRLSLTIGDNGR
jgi:hypothetical protein